MFPVYDAVFCCLVIGCQYQCNQSPGKTGLQITYCGSTVTLNPTHSLIHSLSQEPEARLYSFGASRYSLKKHDGMELHSKGIVQISYKFGNKM